MTAPLSYLFLTKLKNQIRSFFKSPVRIVYLLLVAGIIALTIFSGNKMNPPGRGQRDIRELAAGITAFYTVMFVITAYAGFGNGASLFSMADVNMIFTAPLTQRKVLFYGLFLQMGKSLMLGVFILFQYAWLHGVFNISYGTLLLILLGYAVAMYFGQITAMVLYAFTSADDTRRRTAKIIFFTFIAALVAFVAVSSLGDRSEMLAKAVAAVNGPIVRLFPVSGWTGRIIGGVMTGNTAEILPGFLLCAAYLIGMIMLLSNGKQDFYEDVLKSSEISQSAITARKEGRTGDISPSRVKVGKTGIGKGCGADVFYYKHRLENRRSRIFILEPMSMIYGVMIIVMAFFMKGAGITSVFTTATIFQIFVVLLGRFTKELSKPYIYLIPEPPLKKMLYAMAELLPSAILEAVVVFVPVAVILGATPLDAALCILARLSFAFLFTGVNVAVERLWGGSSKALAMLLFFGILIAMAVPGIVLAAVMGALYTGAGQNAAVFVSLMVCNILVTLLTLFLCRNMLQYAELNSR